MSDKAIEAAGAGTDRVDSAVSFTLGANVENLTLTGAAAISGAGNTLANIIIGNSANNTLSGGAGVDSLRAVSAMTVTSSTTSPIRSWRAPAPAPTALSVP